MSLTRKTAPLSEPITLEDLKIYLKLEIDDDDNLLNALIEASTVHLESTLNMAFISQEWTWTLHCWPPYLNIPLFSAHEIKEIRVKKADGTWDIMVLDEVVLDENEILFDFMPPFPATKHKGIEIDFEAGYGTSEDVPAPLRLAVKMLAAYWYEHRALAERTGDVAILPISVKNLIAPYKRVRLV